MKKVKKLLSFSLCAVIGISMFFGNVLPVLSASTKDGVERGVLSTAVYSTETTITTMTPETTTDSTVTTSEPVTVPDLTAKPATGPAIIVEPEPSPEVIATPVTKKLPQEDDRIFFYLLNRGKTQPSEIANHPKPDYSQGRPGTLVDRKSVSVESDVAGNLNTIPDFSDLLFNGEYIKWYVIKYYQTDGWHIDGIIMNQHTVKVYYLYDQTEFQASDPVEEFVMPNQDYNIKSPAIEGYTPSKVEVAGRADKENFEGIVEYVFYKSNVTEPTKEPTMEPSTEPSTKPTTNPTTAPTTVPTTVPTTAPTPVVVVTPTATSTPLITPTPTVTPSPTQAPTPSPEELIITDEDTPLAAADNAVDETAKITKDQSQQAAKKLPQTGTTSIMVFYVLGIGLIGFGSILLIARKHHIKRH